jgi:hypothetical protein
MMMFVKRDRSHQTGRAIPDSAAAGDARGGLFEEEPRLKSSKADQYPDHAPAGEVCRLFLAGCFFLLAVCLFLLVPAVMFAVAFVNGIANAFNSIGIIAAILGVLLRVAELLWLLQVGQYGQFAMKLIETLSSPTSR